MLKRSLSEVDAKSIHKIIFSHEDLDNTIELLNSKIAPIEFKINKVVCEQNGKIDYVFIATFVDEFKQDPNKLMFNKLVNYIIEAGGRVQFEDAINFDSKMSKTLMENFFQNKYLCLDDDQNIYLSSLALSELEGYLAEKFNRKRCMCCMGIVAQGIRCQSCEQLAHGHCLNAYFENVRSQKCPKCSNQLPVEWNPVSVVNQI